MEKFTQEVKDMWLEALKSGNYTQGYGRLVSEDKKSHCCIGVLGLVHPELTTEPMSMTCPYEFLKRTIGEDVMTGLWEENDKFSKIHELRLRPEDYKDDYSNVIPLIEALPVQS